MGDQTRFSAPVLVVVLTLALCLVGIASANRVSFSEGNSQISFDAHLFPSKLPAHESAPAEFSFSTRVSSLDGSHPSPMRELRLRTDRQVAFNLKKVPVCHYTRTLDVEIDWDRCRDAVVGNGMIEFEIAFPEAAPIAADGNVLVYNGGIVNGKRRLWLRFSITIPTSAIFVDPMDITRMGNGSSRLALSISKVAGGNGSLRYLSLRLGRGAFGSCSTGRLRFWATGYFADGSHPAGQLISRCRRG